MTNFKLTLLAAAAIGAVSIGTASAMPLGGSPATGEGSVQNVRVVCDAYGRCYNTNSHRSSRHYSYNDGYDNRRYHRRDRDYRYSDRAVGFGPFGIWVR